MTAAATLRRARELIAGGWTPGCWARMCEDTDGRACEPSAEMVRLFTVAGALAVSARSADELLEAQRILDQVHHPLLFSADELLLELPPATGPDLQRVRSWLQLSGAAVKARETYLDEWLERPHRKLADVLKLFDLAISRASAREAA